MVGRKMVYFFAREYEDTRMERVSYKDKQKRVK